MRRTLDFPETAERFRIIDEATTGVLVRHGEGATWAEHVLAGQEHSRGKLRQLQPYTVALYQHQLSHGLATGEIDLAEKTGVHVFIGR